LNKKFLAASYTIAINLKMKVTVGLFKKIVQSCPEPVEGKAAASWTGGAYEGVHERVLNNEDVHVQICPG
jgi:hypothetical protein